MKPAHDPTIGCPACGHVLTPLRVGDVTIDACRGGCEGIWFDAAELLRFDEKHEPFPEELLGATPSAGVEIDPSLKRNCPRCLDPVLRRHSFSATSRVEVDQCPGCGGYWLDARELKMIRDEFTSAEMRQKAQAEFVRQLPKRHLQGDAKTYPPLANRAQTLDSLFRLVGSRYTSAA